MLSPMSVPLCLLSFICIDAIAASAQLDDPLAKDGQALLTIKNTLQTSSKTNLSLTILQTWNFDNASTSSPCQWSGVSCSTFQGQQRVTGVDLSRLKLKGPLVSGFAQLTALSTLNLSNNNFNGPVSADIVNCTNLTILDLSSNNLSAYLPSNGFTALTDLQILDLSRNKFSISLLSVLPRGCGQLQSLNLSFNLFEDYGSYSWENCTNLKLVDLSSNQLAGSMSSKFGQLHNLTDLIVSSNNLTGTIPSSLFTYSSSLRRLDLSANRLSGVIPAEIGNSGALQQLILSENEFIGSIPPQIGQLENLQFLMLGSNNLTGNIPSQLKACTNLESLDLSSNHFQGFVPTFLGRMLSLKHLALHSNHFSGSIPKELGLLSRLEFLDLSNNSLSGSISIQLANLSSLQFLLLAANRLTGSIPSELGNISGLQFLDLSNNHLVGHIPSSLGKLQSLLWLMLAHNNLTGEIPGELGNCTSLLWLNLRSNQLTGNFPEGMSRMGRDSTITFEFNRKNFHPPKAAGECLMLERWIPEDYPPFSFVHENFNRDRCQALWIKIVTGNSVFPTCGKEGTPGGYIQLADNKLTGSLPSKFAATTMSFLLLSLNQFTGNLPSSVGYLPLTLINVSNNNFDGHIPDSLGRSNTCLSFLDLSFNNFSGPIPRSLGNLTQLAKFNVSYNPYLSGAVPANGQFLTFSTDSYINDTRLCFELLPGMSLNASLPSDRSCYRSSASGPPNGTLSSASSNSTPLVAISITTCLAVVLCGLVCLFVMKKWPGRSALQKFIPVGKDLQGSFSESLTTTKVCMFERARSSLGVKRLTYTDILLATNNFDESNVIGCGGFGVVYKALLEDGTSVAIKKLIHSGPQGDREFMAEMETLGNHVHDNLVPLLGCCIFASEKLLVYKLLPNGSLEDWLYDKPGGAEMLDWSKRLWIAYGTAKGLKFLHHQCSPMVIHRDMKASNILLDENFKGYLTDFGLARELDPGYTHVSTVIAGTLGYVPPEYSQSWRATTKGDVYSFGVVLLELITGKRPISASDNSDGNLVEWVRMLVREGRGADVYDERVKRTAGRGGEGLCVFLEVAVWCTMDAPEHRPSMEEVEKALEHLYSKDCSSRPACCVQMLEDGGRSPRKPEQHCMV